MDAEHAKRLARSRRLHWELTPILIDQNGRIIDGWHRKAAGWKRFKVLQVKDDLHYWILRLHANVQASDGLAPHKNELIANFWMIGLELERKGIDRHKICRRIVSKISPF
jgi:hypothetical protein